MVVEGLQLDKLAVMRGRVGKADDKLRLHHTKRRTGECVIDD